MKIGFARQSTTHQKFGLENQVELLTNEGCEKIFCEETSGASAKRPEFEKIEDGQIYIPLTKTTKLILPPSTIIFNCQYGYDDPKDSARIKPLDDYEDEVELEILEEYLDIENESEE